VGIAHLFGEVVGDAHPTLTNANEHLEAGQELGL